ncbi:hypothetical protein L6452_01603 [Arctium lappa]|uniref:Uncharacterized protein n=1 Tax=Arctium lappa TaxID=4217 RepID=A0ACB9FGK0_ARCLA|nr:hypothetical protein L6452_01603 [Arctium lappa]
MESSQRNQDHYSSNHNEVQEQDQDRIRNNFSDGYSSHDHVRLQTSCNINGGVLGLHESCNNQQFPANGIILNPQAGGPIGLRLRKSPSLIKKLELILTQAKQRERHREHDQPAPKTTSKAINIPAVFLKIGSWERVSKNELDLVAKFYYGRKKLIWEFLYGSLKKKIEIRWSQISAINAFVGEDKKGGIKIELSQPPEFGQEIKFKAGKHTLWGPSDDFTQGQASVCRRHTVVFPLGVLDEAFKKLLHCDRRLSDVSRQPFPTHNSPLFCNQILDFSNNRSVVHGSSSVSNYGHQGTLILPPVQNLVQPTTSFVGHSNSNMPMPDLKFSSSDEVAVGVPFKKQRIDGIWEQSGNSQVQEISFPPNGDQQDHLLPNHGEESWILDQELGMHLTDIQSLAEFTNNLSWIPDLPQELHLTDIQNHPNDQFADKQNFFEVESACKPFKENHQMINGFAFNDVDQSHVNGELAFMEDNPWKPMENRIHDSSSVTNHMAFEDDGLCSIDHESGFNNRFVFMEPISSWPSSQFSTQDFNNGGNGMNQNTDSRNLQSFDPSGGNGELAFQNPNSGAN